ncbi:hypothetical protein K2173_018549 [Erythroxylum novogranatense]|uniref:DUF4378 domain-containing protein n=1 Tax=Erythroxylum novogranatense TaxID=1862640 RepID=A0AAV8UAK3_9ROSI|nr:hypothetical protein K2173_018549 [Erythroxylum novogranatense]
MMAQKHSLHELLQEDQEPFFLKDYIAHRLKTTSSITSLQVKKPKSVSPNSNFNHMFCKNACVFSFTNSPDPRKSPLFEFQSPARNPCKSPNAIFLNIPARTAAVLLEAALRIQKQSSPSQKARTQNKNNGFGLFGSILKTLKNRNKTRKREISGQSVNVSVKDILKWDPSVGRKKLSKAKSENLVQESTKVGVKVKSASDLGACETSFSCSFNRRPSSAVWSESNEDKSLDLDLETSSSSNDQLDEDKELVRNVEFISKDGVSNFVSYDNHFCESPFHFVLRRSHSPGRSTPDFSSPVGSPCHIRLEGEDNKEVESLKKFQVQNQDTIRVGGEEDTEQCSPVSVLDPTFDADDDGHDDQSEDGGFELERGYAIVQRAGQELLRKLRRFQKLAELDPVELEKRMVGQEQEDDDENDNDNDFHDLDEEAESESDGLVPSVVENEIDKIILEQLGESATKIPRHMKKLVSDLVESEKEEQSCYGDAEEVTLRRVCKRLESWKEVQSNTIDMMVEQDFNVDYEKWKRNQEQVGEAALEIELGILGLLMEELTEELGLNGI